MVSYMMCLCIYDLSPHVMYCLLQVAEKALVGLSSVSRRQTGLIVPLPRDLNWWVTVYNILVISLPVYPKIQYIYTRCSTVCRISLVPLWSQLYQTLTIKDCSCWFHWLEIIMHHHNIILYG